MRELTDGKKRPRVLLVSRVAHDFDNLLMVVHGSAEALCRRVPLNDKAKLYADAITPLAGIADRG